MSRQSLSFSFFLAMQFYYYRLPDETKKIWPKTENYPHPPPRPPAPPPQPAAQKKRFQAVIFERLNCLRCSFWLLAVFRHFSPFLC